MWFVIGIYLVLVFALPIGVGAAMSYRGLPVGRACPHCGNVTLRLVSRPMQHVSLVLPGVLQRRWCMCCGWEGAVRLSREPRQAITPAGASWRSELHRVETLGLPDGHGAIEETTGARPDRGDGGSRREPAAPRDARPMTQTLDVRSLTLDGTPWRVMLQCWRTTGCYYGRFVFVAPSGRLWLDAIEAFTGASEHEVLGQALSLPDILLATRLRRLVTEP